MKRKARRNPIAGKLDNEALNIVLNFMVDWDLDRLRQLQNRYADAFMAKPVADFSESKLSNSAQEQSVLLLKESLNIIDAEEEAKLLSLLQYDLNYMWDNSSSPGRMLRLIAAVESYERWLAGPTLIDAVLSIVSLSTNPNDVIDGKKLLEYANGKREAKDMDRYGLASINSAHIIDHAMWLYSPSEYTLAANKIREVVPIVPLFLLMR